MPRWRQIDGELVLVDQGHGGNAPRAPVIHADIEPFTSPIDGRVIGSRAALRAHNEEHDVVQHREYGENEGKAFFERQWRERSARMQGLTQRDRQERLEIIARAVADAER